jgi:hypothetical protein
VEIKWRNKRVGKKEVERLAGYAKELNASGWLISRSGFTDEALVSAQNNKIFLSDRIGLRELRSLTD